MSGNGTGSVTFTGTVAEINAALNGLSYAPDQNSSGGDTLTITANDNDAAGGPLSATKRVPIIVNAVNDAADLSADVRDLTETNSAAAISSSGTLTISDVDSAATFVAQAGTVGLYGTFAINAAGAWTYTASSAHNEFPAGTTYTDTFSVASSDGTLTSVTINIAGSNDAPAANAQSLGTDKDTAVAVMLSGSDVDSNSLTFAVLSGPAHGTLSGSGANRTYTPDRRLPRSGFLQLRGQRRHAGQRAVDRQPERAPEHCARGDGVRPVGRARAGVQCVGPVLGHRR